MHYYHCMHACMHACVTTTTTAIDAKPTPSRPTPTTADLLRLIQSPPHFTPTDHCTHALLLYLPPSAFDAKPTQIPPHPTPPCLTRPDPNTHRPTPPKNKKNNKRRLTGAFTPTSSAGRGRSVRRRRCRRPPEVSSRGGATARFARPCRSRRRAEVSWRGSVTQRPSRS